MVSVVIPARNAEATLAETLRSVLIEPEVNEVIIVDDGSTDDTAEIAHQLQDPRIQVTLGPQSGIPDALNAGFALVKSPFVARCDADDLYKRGRLSWQLAWLTSHPDFIAVSGGFTTTFPDGTPAADLACTGESRDVTEQLQNGEPISHFCSWLIRTSAIRKVSGARPWFISAQDLDLQFRLAEVGRIWHVPQVAYLYRLHDTSITHYSKSALITFFNEQAREFAKERRRTGKDPLQLGCPPELPSATIISELKTSALSQAISHLVGAAWEEYEMNNRGDAYQRLRAALRRYPFSRTLWWHMLILTAKHFKRFVF
jgi:glycosyltransferase involved in cell wall biosynthesis